MILCNLLKDISVNIHQNIFIFQIFYSFYSNCFCLNRFEQSVSGLNLATILYMAINFLKEMKTIFAEYNPQRNSIDVYTSAGYMLRIDCLEAEKNLKTTPGSECALTSLAIHQR